MPYKELQAKLYYTFTAFANNLDFMIGKYIAYF